jgi:TetR/AcrR family transcriptional regulator, transcriptional repressor for nem operon
MLINDHSVSNSAGGSGRRMTKGEQTRRKIVAAAAPIFNQHGYEGSSLAELMAATGLQKGGIYRHFASKEELAAEAFDYTWKTAWETRIRNIDENSPAPEKLKQLVANFVERRAPVCGGCPILNMAVESDDGNPMLRERVAKALRSWMAFLQAIVKEGIESGTMRVAADPKTVAVLVVASLEGALMMSRIERNHDSLRRVQGHLNRYIDNELAAAAGAPELAGVL